MPMATLQKKELAIWSEAKCGICLAGCIVLSRLRRSAGMTAAWMAGPALRRAVWKLWPSTRDQVRGRLGRGLRLVACQCTNAAGPWRLFAEAGALLNRLGQPSGLSILLDCELESTATSLPVRNLRAL